MAKLMVKISAKFALSSIPEFNCSKIFIGNSLGRLVLLRFVTFCFF